MSTLYLIRHGKTRANLEHRYCGSSDLPLSEQGIEELRGLNYCVGTPRFYTSGMLRTEQTLKILQRTDSTAHCQRYKYLSRRPFHHISDCVAGIAGSSDIQKDDLVRPLG